MPGALSAQLMAKSRREMMPTRRRGLYPGLIIEFQFEQQRHAELIRKELFQEAGILLVRRNRWASKWGR